jgi:hypothetical protein
MATVAVAPAMKLRRLMQEGLQVMVGISVSVWNTGLTLGRGPRGDFLNGDADMSAFDMVFSAPARGAPLPIERSPATKKSTGQAQARPVLESGGAAPCHAPALAGWESLRRRLSP